MNISEGEREAEDMIVEAYTAVLLAFLSLERYLVYLFEAYIFLRFLTTALLVFFPSQYFPYLTSAKNSVC